MVEGEDGAGAVGGQRGELAVSMWRWGQVEGLLHWPGQIVEREPERWRVVVRLASGVEWIEWSAHAVGFGGRLADLRPLDIESALPGLVGRGLAVVHDLHGDIYQIVGKKAARVSTFHTQ